jgi:cell division transport system permease protein
MKLGFFLREAMRSLGRNAMPSFAAMATVLVTMLVLGVFIPIVQATTGAANEVRGRLLLDVYMKTDSTSADVARVQARLNDTAHVKRVEYVSKSAAYRQERARNPEAYQLLGSNPLPDTFRVTPDKASNIDRLKDALQPPAAGGKSGRPVDAAIETVRNRRDETSKILSATRVVKLTTAMLAILLVTASILLISNTIRLSLYARRREVEVMKLVGATDWIIRWPFVIEGVIVGALGGLLAILLLAIGKVALIDPLANDFALLAAPETINFGLLIVVLISSSVLVSAAGSGLSLRRFLRV